MTEAKVVERVNERSEEMATKINNLILYGIYKVLGAGAKGLGNSVGEELLNTMMEEYGLNFEGSDDPQELLNRFTEVMINTLGFAERGEIIVNGNNVTLKLDNPMDLYALQLLEKKGMKPMLYPMANAIAVAIKKFSGKNVLIKEIRVSDKHVEVDMLILG
ncbi:MULTISPECIES: hypothetical protein [Thermococcus]|uniref:Uncharacterized protein n=1 Tax=Thermococcus nautili TaxID=195522 RepID=W8NRL2_9EURY|nr:MULTISPECIES: hypothetical protein [Thermococcus]AHL21858.1 hypothetical protein BD01_0229 [Thermococcus nautili]NJE48902.1 hypothetical protein [Thermococcus sp. 9N3]CAI1494104.1 conserved protein of unknown function [Thermococcus nautili]